MTVIESVQKLKSKICSKNFIKDRFPFLKWLPNYTFTTLLQDLLAGITVGMTEIPQGVGYAIIAGLPPEYGLYSGLLDGFIYAIFGSIKDVNIGPSSILALMMQGTVSQFGPQGAILSTFLSGIIILIFGISKLGFVANFFSYPVIAGFICGGCIQVASSQLLALLGLSGNSTGFINIWTTICGKIQETRMGDLTLGLSTLIFLIFFKHIIVFGSLKNRADWSKFRNILGKLIAFASLGSGALVLIIGTGISYIWNDLQLFKTTGNVTEEFPKFHLPTFTIFYNDNEYNFGDFLTQSGVSLIVLPLMSILEALTIAKVFNKTQKIDTTQEILALGLCNFVGSFIGSMPVTGSFTRTTVNNISGVKTTLSGVFTSTLLILVIAFLTPTFAYLPKATLAAILLNAIIHLFDYKAPILLWKTKKLDLIPFLVTFFCAIFINTETGMLSGAAIHILFVLYGSATPKINITKQEFDGGKFAYVITPRDTLYFPAAENLRDSIMKFDENQLPIIINGQNIQSMDATVARVLVCLMEEMTVKNYKIVLTNFQKSVKKTCIAVDKNMEKYFNGEDYMKVI